MAEVVECKRFDCFSSAGDGWSGHCSNKCYQKTWYENKRGIDRQADQSRMCALEGCTKNLAGRQTRAMYCSRTCKTAAFWLSNPEYGKLWAKKNRPWEARRAREKSAFVYGVDLSAINGRIEYWGGCWICGQGEVERDHVKPIAKGGLHIPANIRPICSPCNKVKSARWFGVQRLEDLRLFVLSRRGVQKCR